ncbi:MAG TPA: phosphoglycolate phosphatase, partial [Bacteroidetes bacterium]|nr:phosphoglycolate phosphatase [Bacteroidota bacterium]
PEKKPNPGMILKLIDKYNLNPGETVMIGDMWKDIMAAKSAGIKSVFVKNSHSDLKNSIPDFKINNLSELINIIK